MTPPTIGPTTGPTSSDEVLATLRALQARDLPTHGGRTLAYVYDSGLARCRRRRARGPRDVRRRRTASTRPPSPRCCRWRTTSSRSPADCSTPQTGFAGVGHLRRHRVDPARGPRRPARRARTSPTRAWSSRRRRMRPSTRRPSSCGVAPSSSTSTPSPCAPTPRRWPPRSTTRTVLVVASAPSYAHGVVDPVAADRRRWRPRAASAATSTPASAAGCCPTCAAPSRPAAVDLRRRGRHEPVASTCTSTPTRPRASRCCCTASPALRRAHFFASADWPGYTMLNTHDAVDQVRRPAGRGLGGRTQRIGAEGYADAGPRGARRRRSTLAAAVGRHPGPARAGPARTRRWSPSSPTTRCDVFTIADEMLDRGWFVQPQMSLPRRARRRLHLTLSAATAPSVPELVVAPARVGRRRPCRRAGRPRPRARRGAARRHRPGDPRRGGASPGCSPPPASRAATARSPCPAGWRRSTPCSTPARRPLREALLLGVARPPVPPDRRLSAGRPHRPLALAPAAVLAGADPAPQPEGRRWPPRRWHPRCRPRPVAHGRPGHPCTPRADHRRQPRRDRGAVPRPRRARRPSDAASG